MIRRREEGRGSSALALQSGASCSAFSHPTMNTSTARIRARTELKHGRASRRAPAPAS